MRKLIDTTILIILLIGPAALLMSFGQNSSETTPEPIVETVDQHGMDQGEELAQLDYPRP